jgi:hypothetical protein
MKVRYALHGSIVIKRLLMEIKLVASDHSWITVN